MLKPFRFAYSPNHKAKRHRLARRGELESRCVSRAHRPVVRRCKNRSAHRGAKSIKDSLQIAKNNQALALQSYTTTCMNHSNVTWKQCRVTINWLAVTVTVARVALIVYPWLS